MLRVLEESPIESSININVLSDLTNLPGPSTSGSKPTTLQDNFGNSTMESSININVLSDLTNLPGSSTSGSKPTTLQDNFGNVGRLQLESNKKKTAQCRKYLQNICRLKSTIKKMKLKNTLNILDDDTSFNKLSKKLTPAFSLLLQGQIRNFKKKLKGHRWTEEEKIIALRLYKRSPTCYRLMRRLFVLPSPSSLKMLLSKFKLKVGINERIFQMLEKYSKTLKKEDNHFVLMFDEMSIKKNLHYNKHEDLIEGFQDHGIHGRTFEEATHALVFMLAGVRKAVKQPIAFFLSGSHVTADRLSVIIKEVVQACLNVGINIQSLVCDMAGVNYRAYKLLGATEARPVIKIGAKDVVTMFDTPHLLKCFRNLFLKYDIKCPTDLNTPVQSMGIAKWSHIRQFYELDRNDAVFVHAPALSNIHIDPNTKQKMRVYLAVQVLSHSVASGMFGKIAKGDLTTEAVVTASVVGNMDKLFDLVNSSSADLKRCKPFATNISTVRVSPHLEFFKKMTLFFQKVEFLGCNRDPPSRLGWIWTMKAIQLVWDNMKCQEIESVATRRLQQDPLENYFSLIRSNYCGTNTNPTVGQFRAAMKTSLLGKLPFISSGNCEKDNNDVILDNYKKLLSSENEKCEEACEIEYEAEEVSSMEDGQACAYVCGFIIRKLGNSCPTCHVILNASEEEDIHTFISFREYSDKHKSLFYANRQLVECVDQTGKIVMGFLSDNSHASCLKNHVQTLIMRSVNFDFLKKCPEHFENVRLFIIQSVFYILVKRFCILKNRKFAEDTQKILLKKKIDLLKNA